MHNHLIWILILLYILNRAVGWWIIVYSKSIGWIGSIVVLLTAVVIIGLPIAPQPRLYSLGSSGFIAGVSIGIFLFTNGLIFMIRGDKEFHKSGTRPDNIPTKLVTTGIYSVVRHPQYIGLNICFIGWSLVWSAIYCFYLIPMIIFLNWLQAFLEEKYMLKKIFGDKYAQYKKEVGMFFPHLRKSHK